MPKASAASSSSYFSSASGTTTRQSLRQLPSTSILTLGLQAVLKPSGSTKR